MATMPHLPAPRARSRWLSRALGAGLCALGAGTALARLLVGYGKIAPLPASLQMTLTGALLFTGVGVVWLMPPHSARCRAATLVVGLTTSSVGVFSACAQFFGLGWSFDELLLWMLGAGQQFSRMAPNTSLAFALVGSSLILMTRVPTRGRRIALIALNASLFVLGMVSLVGHVLSFESLYSWYRHTRMSAHTAFAFVAIAAATYWELRASPWHGDVEREERRITGVATAILVAIGLGAGIAGLAFMQKASEQTITQGVALALDYSVSSIEHEIEHELGAARALARKASLRAALRSGAREDMQTELERLLDGNYQSVSLFDANGQLLGRAGERRTALLDVHLDGAVPSSLRWDGGAALDVEVPIEEPGERLGSLRIGVRLPYVTRLLQEPRAPGERAVLELCARDGAGASCFPGQNGEPGRGHPLLVSGELTPMGRALSGQSGVMSNVVDWRGQSVFAAFQPLPRSHLGVVLNVQAGELYAPIARRLQQMLPLLFAMIALGVWLVHAEVAPLVAELASSEQRAVSAIREVMRGERHTRAIVDGVSDGIITLDEHGVVGSFNPAAVRMFGFDASDVIGRTLAPLLSEESYEKHARALAQPAHALNLGTAPAELEARRKDGTALTIELTVNEIRTGERPFFVGLVRDVSERRRIERLKNDFVATVSHELRTPLTSIRGSLGLIANGVFGKVSPDVERLVGIAHDNSQRLVSMVNDMLDIEKIEAGRMNFRFGPEEVQPLLRRAVETTAGYAQQFGVTVSTSDDLGDASVMADPDGMHQVLVNLLSNAVKYSPRGGTVRVSAVRHGELVRIMVSDQGPGIPAAFRERIFEKFSQADSSDRRSRGGTGLGLSIAKAIVDHHGGRIAFESEPGRGTTFFVELPVMGQSDASAAATPTSQSRLLFRAPAILHVEDDIESRKLIEKLLEPIARVVGAGTLSAARARLAESRFDLVLLDMELPDGCGAALLDELADGEAPVVVFTAHEDVLLGQLPGRVASIMIKTQVSAEQFQAKVLELVRPPGSSQKAVS